MQRVRTIVSFLFHYTLCAKFTEYAYRNQLYVLVFVYTCYFFVRRDEYD